MAGMFYSLKEAAEKLNKTEKEVKQLAKQGKLREFRDGSNLLFKMDEVEALMADTSITPSEEVSVPLEEPAQPVGAVESEGPQPQKTAAESPEQAPEPEPAKAPEPPTEPELTEGTAEQEEISLVSEAGPPVAEAAESELSSADTALAGEGISVLGETDRDYQVTDDTMAETTAVPGATGTAGTTGTTGEVSLEEIEGDVNLDTFGSGSGLLDLSLQADDTSLGGILDEIYTTEGGEEGAEPAEPGSAVEVAAEVEQILPEEELTRPQPAMGAPAIAQPYVEVPPDALSNSLGIMLFLPLLALIYAAIVTVAGLKGVTPAILAKIQTPYVALYIVAGFLVAAGLTFGISLIFSGGVSGAGKRQKKPKKAKKAKKTSPEAPENAGV